MSDTGGSSVDGPSSFEGGAPSGAATAHLIDAVRSVFDSAMFSAARDMDERSEASVGGPSCLAEGLALVEMRLAARSADREKVVASSPDGESRAEDEVAKRVGELVGEVDALHQDQTQVLQIVRKLAETFDSHAAAFARNPSKEDRLANALERLIAQLDAGKQAGNTNILAATQRMAAAEESSGDLAETRRQQHSRVADAAPSGAAQCAAADAAAAAAATAAEELRCRLDEQQRLLDVCLGDQRTLATAGEVGRLRQDLEQRLQSLEERLAQGLAAQLESLRIGRQDFGLRLQSLDERLTQGLAAEVEGLGVRVGRQEQDLGQRLQSLDDRLTQGLAAEVEGLSVRVGRQEQDLGQRLQSLDERLTQGFAAEVEGLSVRVGRQEQDLGQRLQSLDERLTQGLAAEAEGLSVRVGRQEQDLEQRLKSLEERLASTEAQMRHEHGRVGDRFANLDGVMANVEGMLNASDAYAQKREAALAALQKRTDAAAADLEATRSEGQRTTQAVADVSQRLHDVDRRLGELASVASAPPPSPSQEELSRRTAAAEASLADLAGKCDGFEARECQRREVALAALDERVESRVAKLASSVAVVADALDRSNGEVSSAVVAVEALGAQVSLRLDALERGVSSKSGVADVDAAVAISVQALEARLLQRIDAVTNMFAAVASDERGRQGGAAGVDDAAVANSVQALEARLSQRIDAVANMVGAIASDEKGRQGGGAGVDDTAMSSSVQALEARLSQRIDAVADRFRDAVSQEAQTRDLAVKSVAEAVSQEAQKRVTAVRAVEDTVAAGLAEMSASLAATLERVESSNAEASRVTELVEKLAAQVTQLVGGEDTVAVRFAAMSASLAATSEKVESSNAEASRVTELVEKLAAQVTQLVGGEDAARQIERHSLLDAIAERLTIVETTSAAFAGKVEALQEEERQRNVAASTALEDLSSQLGCVAASAATAMQDAQAVGAEARAATQSVTSLTQRIDAMERQGGDFEAVKASLEASCAAAAEAAAQVAKDVQAADAEARGAMQSVLSLTQRVDAMDRGGAAAVGDLEAVGARLEASCAAIAAEAAAQVAKEAEQREVAMAALEGRCAERWENELSKALEAEQSQRSAANRAQESALSSLQQGLAELAQRISSVEAAAGEDERARQESALSSLQQGLAELAQRIYSVEAAVGEGERARQDGVSAYVKAQVAGELSEFAGRLAAVEASAGRDARSRSQEEERNSTVWATLEELAKRLDGVSHTVTCTSGAFGRGDAETQRVAAETQRVARAVAILESSVSHRLSAAEAAAEKERASSKTKIDGFTKRVTDLEGSMMAFGQIKAREGDAALSELEKRLGGRLEEVARLAASAAERSSAEVLGLASSQEALAQRLDAVEASRLEAQQEAQAKATELEARLLQRLDGAQASVAAVSGRIAQLEVPEKTGDEGDVVDEKQSEEVSVAHRMDAVERSVNTLLVDARLLQRRQASDAEAFEVRLRGVETSAGELHSRAAAFEGSLKAASEESKVGQANLERSIADLGSRFPELEAKIVACSAEVERLVESFATSEAERAEEKEDTAWQARGIVQTETTKLRDEFAREVREFTHTLGEQLDGSVRAAFQDLRDEVFAEVASMMVQQSMEVEQVRMDKQGQVVDWLGNKGTPGPPEGSSRFVRPMSAPLNGDVRFPGSLGHHFNAAEEATFRRLSPQLQEAWERRCFPWMFKDGASERSTSIASRPTSARPQSARDSDVCGFVEDEGPDPTRPAGAYGLRCVRERKSAQLQGYLTEQPVQPAQPLRPPSGSRPISASPARKLYPKTRPSSARLPQEDFSPEDKQQMVVAVAAGAGTTAARLFSGRG